MSFDRRRGGAWGDGPGGSGSTVVGKRTLTESLPIQRKAEAGVEVTTRPPDAPSAGSGRPLDGGTRTGMEAAFGADFSGVRVHEDLSPASIGAIAYTRGADVHFAPGSYDPGGAAGRELLAHELTHVVQQRRGDVAATQGKGVADEPALEREADETAARVVRGEGAGPISAARVGVQRKETTLSVQVITEGDRVDAINIAGRSESPFPHTMGSHTTAWVVHCDHVRGALYGLTIPRALARMAELYKEVQGLPMFAPTLKSTLAEKFTKEMEALGANMTSAVPLLVNGAPAAAGARLHSLLQEAIGHYLSARNFMAGATVEAGKADGRGEGSSRGNLAELDRDPTQDQAPAARRAIWDLFDFTAVVTATAAPGAPSNAFERAVLLLGQHLIDVRDAYPHSFRISGIAEGTALQELIAEYLTAAKVDPAGAAKVAQAALAVLGKSPPSAALKARATQWTLAKTADLALEDPLGTATAALAKLLAANGDARALLTAWKKLIVAAAMLDTIPEEKPENPKPVNLAAIDAHAQKQLEVIVLKATTAATAGATEAQLVQLLSVKDELMNALRPVVAACDPATVVAQLAAYQTTWDSVVDPLRAVADAVGIRGQQQYAAQVVVGDDGTIPDFAIGRPPSPFSNMGAHTTAWVIHADALRNAVVGQSAGAAAVRLCMLAASLLGQGNDVAPACVLMDEMGVGSRADLDAAIDELREASVGVAAAVVAKNVTIGDLQLMAQAIAHVQNLMPLATLDLDGERGGKGERSLQNMLAEATEMGEDDGSLDGRLALQIWTNFDWAQALSAVTDTVEDAAVTEAVDAAVHADVLSREKADELDDDQQRALHYDTHAPGLPADHEERLAVLLATHRHAIDQAYPWLRSSTPKNVPRFPKACITLHTVPGLLQIIIAKCPADIDLDKMFKRLHELYPIPLFDGKPVGAKVAAAKDEKKQAKAKPKPKKGRQSAKKQREDDDAEWDG